MKVFLLLSALLFFSAVSQSCHPNIVDLAVQVPSLSTLVSLVIKQNLVKALSSNATQLVVFAPNDKAFENANAGLFPANQLSSILLYHVAASRSHLNESVKLISLTEQLLNVVVTDSQLTVNGYSNKIIRINACNGVIAVVDHVLIPPCGVGLPNIVQTAVASPSLSTLVSLVQYANLVSVLSSPGPFTVFAPTNQAFVNAHLPSNLTVAEVASVLTYHVVSGRILSSDLQASQVVPTANGASLKITRSGNSVTINGNVHVISANIETCNGVVHVIDGVLLPPQ